MQGSCEAALHILPSLISSLLASSLPHFLTPPPSCHREQTAPCHCTVHPSLVALGPAIQPATRHTPRDQSILRGPFEYFPNEDGIIKLSSFPYIYGRQKDHKVMKHDKLFSFLHPQRKIRAEKPRAVRTVEGCQRLLNTPSFSRFQQTCLTWILCVTQCYYRNGLLFFLPHSFPILGNPSSPLIKSAILFLLFGQ